MLLTEEDARTRWCPFARLSMSEDAVEGNHASNRFEAGTMGHRRTRCLASECMAWRWAEVAGTGTPVLDEEAPARVRFEPNPDRKGRCGLAGASPHG